MADRANYGKSEAERYVEFLGCWRYPNVEEAKRKQDRVEYGAALHNLIRVNATRRDRIGVWETAAAERELRRMK